MTTSGIGGLTTIRIHPSPSSRRVPATILPLKWPADRCPSGVGRMPMSRIIDRRDGAPELDLHGIFLAMGKPRCEAGAGRFFTTLPAGPGQFPGAPNLSPSG